MSTTSITFTSFGAGEARDNLTYSFVEDLPFPLSMPYDLRIFFGIYIVFVLAGGLFCRKIILQVLRQGP